MAETEYQCKAGITFQTFRKRVCDRGGGIPAFRDRTVPGIAIDTRNAIRFMKQHSEEYMVDVESMQLRPVVGNVSENGIKYSPVEI